jgi:lipoyl(octanoyl) transferase
MPPLLLVQPGSLPYRDAWDLQRTLHAARVEKRLPHDVLLLLEHPHVLTVGSRSGKPNPWEHLHADRAALEARGVDLVEADRGGDVTWHGPGQLVGYPILDLTPYNNDVSRYVRGLEATTLLVLKALGVRAERSEGFPGVWIDGAKICAIGARIRQRVTMHGFSLNLRGPLEGFGWILPCGLPGRGVTSIEAQLGSTLDDALLYDLTRDAFAATFDLTPQPTALEDVLALCAPRA